MDYVSRIIDSELDELMPDLAAISLEGPKGVGKTATASARANTVLQLDDVATAELIRANPEVLTQHPYPLLIDEWQKVPEVWDRIRRRVDDGAPAGSYILTGSAVPTGVKLHSGAGRIVSLRMRPLSFVERNISQQTVSLSALFEPATDIHGVTDVTLADYVREIVGSGFPGVRMLSDKARRLQLDSYLNRIVEYEFREQGMVVRRPQILKAWMRAYASATASTTSYNKIGQASSIDGNIPSHITITQYREVLQQLWLLDSVEAWVPSNHNFARLASAPKHFLADPALAARLLSLDEGKLLSVDNVSMLGKQEGSALGRLFEHLVALSLKTYAQKIEATVTHFRTARGDHEVDYLIHSNFGGAVGIEVKLSPSISDHDVKHLLWLKNLMGDDLRDMVVINTGPGAYRRDDGVAVVPLALLGA